MAAGLNVIDLSAIRRVTAEESWPDPAPLPSALLPVPEFDPGLLPGELRPYVEDIADRTQCKIDMVAMPAMVGLSAVVGRRIGIRPERNTTWTEPANLWGCIVAPPGSLKSPITREALGPLYELEAEAAEDSRLDQEDFEREGRLFKLQKEEVERAVRARLKAAEGDAVSARYDALDLMKEVREPTAPAVRRHIVNDATPEKLGEICADNPNGLLVHRDELLTHFAELNRDEKSAGRGFMMTGWSGSDGYTFDRIGRGTVRIPAVNLALFGTTQPNRLTAFMKDTFRHHDDGLIQRVQLAAWPDMDRKWKASDRHPDHAAKDMYYACFRRMASITGDDVAASPVAGKSGIPYLHFEPNAQEAFTEWRGGLEAKITDPDTSPHLAAHLSKYRGLIPRLALLCHLAADGFGPVGLKAWGQAEGWSDYLEAHARRIYGAVDRADTMVAEAIIRRIRKGDLSGSFTCRDIYRKGWSGLKDVEAVERALKLLCDFDWLGMDRQMTRGRPLVEYLVNPKIR